MKTIKLITLGSSIFLSVFTLQAQDAEITESKMKEEIKALEAQISLAEQAKEDAIKNKKDAIKNIRKTRRELRHLERTLDDFVDHTKSIIESKETIKELETELISGKVTGELSKKDIYELESQILDEQKDILEDKIELKELLDKMK